MDREELRRKKIEESERKAEEIYKRFPRILEIEKEIQKLLFAKIQTTLSSKKIFGDQADQKITSLINEKENILKQNGLSIDIFEPDWNCKKCSDKGYIRPGVLCECFSRERNNILLERSGLVGEMLNKSFDNFDLDYYIDRQSMQKKIQRCLEFIDNINQKKKQKSLYFFGSVGTGKTHLSLAIANQVLSYDNSVIYKRIDDLLHIIIELKLAEKEKKDQLEILKNADLLVIDDLGAEKNSAFALNQIRIILEERANLNKAMIITSNLDPGSLADYYGPRISDRIIENFDIYELKTEESIRMQKRGKESY